MDTTNSVKYNEERLVAMFADGFTVSEVQRMYEEEFGIRIPVRELVAFKLGHKEEIESKKRELYEQALEELSPAGILRRLLLLVNEVMRSPERAVSGRRLGDVATILRLSLDVWEKDREIKLMNEEEREKLRRQFMEIFRELEENKDLLDIAEKNGLLRFQQIMID